MKKFFGMVLAFVLVLNLCPEIRAYAAENEGYSGSADEIYTEVDTSDNDTEVLPEEDAQEDVSENTQETEDSIGISDNDAVDITEEAAEDVSDNDGAVSEEETEDDEEEGFVVSFIAFEGGSYVAYDRQNFAEAVVTEDASYAIARDSDTGEIDTTGSGQVNFSVVIEEGYSFDGIEVTEGSGNYKNLKVISEEGNVHTYRFTKITGDITVKVNVTKLDIQGVRDVLVSALKEAMKNYPKYYLTYCTPDTASVLENALSAAKKLNLTTASNEEIEAATANIQDAVASLQYKVTEVPQVYISTANGRGNTLSKSKGYVDTDIVIADVDGTIIAEAGTIKVRGNSTAHAEKKPYNIKFSSKHDVFGMGNSKKWCLLANCFDPSLLRNSVALEVAHEMNLAYTSENCFVELWIDGVFKGCYLFTEAVEAGDTRVDIKVKNGEFMIELEKSRVEEGTTYITNANGLRFSFKEPEEPTEEQYQNVKEVLDRVTAAIDSGDYSQVEAAIDVESFAKFFVLNEYMRNNDFNFSSTNFYYKGGKLYAGPAWDFDLSSGNGSEENPDNKRYDKPKALYGNWYPYLFKYSEFQKLAIETFDQYKGYLAGISAEGGFIDKNIEQYINVFKRNFNEAGWEITKRYSTNEMAPFETYEENVEFLSTWLTNRLSWMDEYYHSNNIIPHVWIKSATVEEDNVTISWKAEEGIDGYRVFRKEAETWVPLTGVITDTTYVDYKAEAGKAYYYDVVAVVSGRRASNDKGTYVYVNSKNAVPLTVVRNPENVVLESAEQRVTFSVEASGKGLSYMWYFKNPGANSFTKANVSEAQYSRYISSQNDGLQVYCVITDIYGRTVVTNTASVTIEKEITSITITKDTEDIIPTKVGQKCIFKIEAEGKGLTYNWYYKRPGDTVFYKAGSYTNEYVRTYTENIDGMQAYCVVKDVSGNIVVGRVATLSRKISKIVITNDTADIYAGKVGDRCTFRIEAEGENLSYCWYYKRPGDTVFYKAGSYTNEYVRTYVEQIDGMQVYCVITDSNGNKAVGRKATLSKQKADISINYPLGTELTVAYGKKINFSVEVDSTEEVSYKWYYMLPSSIGGDGIFHNTGCYDSTYCRTATDSINGMQAYCVITDSEGRRTVSETFTFTLK